MKLYEKKLETASRIITVILKIGFLMSNLITLLTFTAICILMFSKGELKSSFFAAFQVTANNGTVICVAPESLFVLFFFMLADSILISFLIFFVHAIFDQIRRGNTPFSEKNTIRIKKIAVFSILLSMIGSYSDALVDYYTIGQLTWRVDLVGLIIGMIIYCISFIFRYGCELQRESDETL